MAGSSVTVWDLNFEFSDLLGEGYGFWGVLIFVPQRGNKGESYRVPGSVGSRAGEQARLAIPATPTGPHGVVVAKSVGDMGRRAGTRACHFFWVWYRISGPVLFVGSIDRHFFLSPPWSCLLD